MIGNGYWSTGIVVRYGYAGSNSHGWAATARFFDDGFCDDDDSAGTISTEGELHTRYFATGENGLAAAIDAVKRDAERLGITFGGHGAGPPCLYYEGDGADENWPPPEGWRPMLTAAAGRLGWDTPYRDSPARTKL